MEKNAGISHMTLAPGHAARRMEEALVQLRARAVARVRDPQFQTLTIRTASGAAILSCVGGAFGAASGIVVGVVGGAVPAIFTLGLSVPAGAALGGGAGLFLGAGTAALGGGAAGYATYAYQSEIRDGVLYVRTRVVDTLSTTSRRLAAGADLSKEKVLAVAARTKRGAESAGAKAIAIGKNPVFQVTSASTVAGGVMGGVVGSTVGTVTGAAIGLVPALFTFGLSIPVGAAVGLCTGAVAGSTTGAVSGGMLGYGGAAYQREIGDGVRGIWDGVRSSADYVKSKATDCGGQLRESVITLVGGGTGGTL